MNTTKTQEKGRSIKKLLYERTEAVTSRVGMVKVADPVPVKGQQIFIRTSSVGPVAETGGKLVGRVLQICLAFQGSEGRDAGLVWAVRGVTALKVARYCVFRPRSRCAVSERRLAVTALKYV